MAPQAPKKQPNWQKALDDLASGSTTFFFMKQPKTRIRLVNQETDPEHFFMPVTSVFRGKEKVKYLVMGVVISTEGRELADNWKNKIVPIVMPKTVIKSILTYLAEGYDFFDPKEGYGITIAKSGSGMEMDYTVLPSPQAVSLPEKVIPADKTLEDFAAAFEEFQRNRGNGGGKNDSEETGW